MWKSTSAPRAAGAQRSAMGPRRDRGGEASIRAADALQKELVRTHRNKVGRRGILRHLDVPHASTM